VLFLTELNGRGQKKWADIAMRTLPASNSALPHPCQPNGTYACAVVAQGAKWNYFRWKKQPANKPALELFPR
jgi:hypothetical protein